MFNDLTPNLFISGSISLLSFIPIHTTVKQIVNCFIETPWLLDSTSLGLNSARILR